MLVRINCSFLVRFLNGGFKLFYWPPLVLPNRLGAKQKSYKGFHLIYGRVYLYLYEIILLNNKEYLLQFGFETD